MRPAEPPGPAGAVSISCVGSPPSIAGPQEVGKLGLGWVVGGQAAVPHPASPHTALTLRLIVKLGLWYPDSPPLGWIWGLHLWCRWKSQELLQLREEV